MEKISGRDLWLTIEHPYNCAWVVWEMPSVPHPGPLFGLWVHSPAAVGWAANSSRLPLPQRPALSWWEPGCGGCARSRPRGGLQSPGRSTVFTQIMMFIPVWSSSWIDHSFSMLYITFFGVHISTFIYPYPVNGLLSIFRVFFISYDEKRKLLWAFL